MIAILNNQLTDVSIESLLKQVMKEYHELNTQLENGVRALNEQYKVNLKSGRYTDDYVQELLSSGLKAKNDEFQKRAENLNQKAVSYIATLKKKILNAFTPISVPSDYAVKVNNALQFLKLEGAEITDEIAFEITKDFVNDIDTMRHFRRVIEHQKGEKLTNAYGNTTFPLTFGRLTNCEHFIKTYSELEELVKQMFIRKKSETETEYLSNGAKLSVPMDGYTQLVSEQRAIEQAKAVEMMIFELFKTS